MNTACVVKKNETRELHMGEKRSILNMRRRKNSQRHGTNIGHSQSNYLECVLNKKETTGVLSNVHKMGRSREIDLITATL